eukprot:350351-Chlamydomonas_euryale.AAC.1
MLLGCGVTHTRTAQWHGQASYADVAQRDGLWSGGAGRGPVGRGVAQRETGGTVGGLECTVMSPTPAKLVCRRPFALNGELRTMRCVPFSPRR